MKTEPQRRATNAQWLARLRWGALAVQAGAIVVATRIVGIDLPIPEMWTLIGIGAASNAWLSWGARESAPLGAYLTLDVVLLTALLYLSGGPTNPFSVIFLVYIALSAVMLSAIWTWTIAGLSVGAFGLLFFFHVPNLDLGHHTQAGFQTHLYGMFFAFVLASSLTAYFVGRLAAAVRAQERALAEARERTLRWGRLASVATLAAGAAHQLGTPLGTIAIAAGEIKRRVEGDASAADLVADAELIGEEVKRCRAVLDQIALSGGEHAGETPTSIAVNDLFAEVRARLSDDQVRRWQAESELTRIQAPKEALVQMVENLVRNGFDACTAGEVALRITEATGSVRMRFSDAGSGMDDETKRRATEPFFTTKGTDDRMGLGLFLATALVDSLNGVLTIDSSPGSGTTVWVTLPQDR